MPEATVEPERGAMDNAPVMWYSKKGLDNLLENKFVSGILTSCTLFALFGDDIRIALLQVSADPAFSVIALILFVVFFVEICVSSYARVDYPFSFYFWLDLISTISLLGDSELVTGGSGSADLGEATSSSGSGVALNTKASRLVRIVRLIRLTRVVKLYKHAKSKDPNKVIAAPSQIGKRMTDITTRRLILLLLTLLIMIPVFQVFSLTDDLVDPYRQFLVDELHRYPQDINISIPFFRGRVNSLIKHGDSLIYLEICDPSGGSFSSTGCQNFFTKPLLYSWLADFQFDDGSKVHPDTKWTAANLITSREEVLANYRTTELDIARRDGCVLTNTTSGDYPLYGTIDPTNAKRCHTIAVFSVKQQATELGWLDLGKTLFVLLMLIVGSLVFTHDSNDLVIEPIERMMNMVEQLSKNPLKKTLVEPEANEAGKESFETTLLEQTLSKIGQLLQIGFGQAGDAIIGKNMSADGELDPMIPGKKIFAIFGFCDIRYFLPLTECLQEDIMLYVNAVASIVHQSVHMYKGSANKNIGDCWLLVWKLPKETDEAALSPKNKAEKKKFDASSPAPDGSFDEFNPSARSPMNRDSINLQNDARIKVIADSSLAAFLRVIVEYKLVRAESGSALSDFEKRPGLAKLDWHLSMGFGLQIGWAIEGAIGSTFKIDASYLSPHVNMASRLEAATKQYHVDILISHYLHCLLSPAAQKLCRKVDRVTVKGSALPMELFTYDIVNITKSVGFKTMAESEAGPDIDFETDAGFLGLQNGIHPQFKSTYEEGMEAYLAGDWGLAKRKLEEADKLKPDDGPIHTLMEVLEEHHFNAPSSWKGFRPLTSK